LWLSSAISSLKICDLLIAAELDLWLSSAFSSLKICDLLIAAKLRQSLTMGPVQPVLLLCVLWKRKTKVMSARLVSIIPSNLLSRYSIFFLSSLSRTAKVDFSLAISEAQNRFASASVRAIKAALGKDKRGNERTLNASVLREYSFASNEVRNLLQILANISSAVDVLLDFSVEVLFSRSDEFKRLSAEMYRDLFSSDLDGANFSALQLIIEVVVPFLKKNSPADRIRAVKLALAICEQSLNTNDGRMNLILQKFRAAASQSMESGGGAVQSTTDYFSCPKRRREAMIVFHGLILSVVIDAKTPGSILEHGGFAVRALGLSWSNLAACCRRIVNADFFGTSSEASFRRLFPEADLEQLPKNIAKETKLKVVIYNRKQMDSLQALASFEDL